MEISGKPEENSEQKTYEIYRYLPKLNSTLSMETTASGKSNGQVDQSTN
jgi:hypothetical protein